MGFFCYDLNYEALPGQLAAAKLETVHNFWSSVYDFTPSKAPPDNFHILGQDRTVLSLLSPMPEEATAALGPGHGKEVRRACFSYLLWTNSSPDKCANRYPLIHRP